MFNTIKRFTILIFALYLSACLENNNVEPRQFETSFEIKLLNYMEVGENFINTDDIPAVIDSKEVYDNLSKFLILDIRSEKHFAQGHIKDAIHIKHQDLYDYLKDKHQSYEKVVIVSYTGQSACYYLTALRYLGINNVYALKFGMCA